VWNPAEKQPWTASLCLWLAASSTAQGLDSAPADRRLEALELRVARLEHRAWSSGPVLLCLDVASDLAPIHPTRAFPSGVSELSLVIEAGAAAGSRELTAVFVAEDVGEAAPPETEMARAVQPASPDRRARFRYHQDGALPPGTYRVELLGDGAPWRTLRCRVLAPSSPPTLSLRLEPARIAHYDFLQEAAPGARLRDGGTPKGDRLEARVEMRVVEAEAGLAHIEFRRDGEPVTQEWWSWDERGLFATRRTVGAVVHELDPPQPLLQAGAGVASWEWRCAGLDFVQRGRQWGPLELEGPWGRAKGYVVRTEQAEGPLLHTVEREFAPGLGLVRERITSARDGRLVVRQELVLRP